MKFRILEGQHTNNEVDPQIGRFLLYGAGCVFESDSDLCQKFNRPGSKRFELVNNFEEMTRAELRQFAAHKKVDVAGLTVEREIIEHLRSAGF